MFGRLVSAALPHRTALFVALFVAGPVNTRGKILTSPPLSLSLSLPPSFFSLLPRPDVLSWRLFTAHLAAFNTSARFSSLPGLPLLFRQAKGERNGRVIVRTFPSAFRLMIPDFDKYSFSNFRDQFLHYICLFRFGMLEGLSEINLFAYLKRNRTLLFF